MDVLQEELEQNCIKRVLEGDPEAFRALVERHQDHVLGIAINVLKNREEAEEVTQDVFLKVYRSLAKYEGKSKFGTWLYRIAYNECISRLRSNKRRPETISHSVSEFDYKEDEDYNFEREEQLDSLEDAVNKLKEGDRLILTLYYQQDLKVKEIAEIVGLSESNVKIRLHRTRSALQKLMNKANHGERIG